jgi:hypothetical protein
MGSLSQTCELAGYMICFNSRPDHTRCLPAKSKKTVQSAACRCEFWLMADIFVDHLDARNRHFSLSFISNP